MLTRLAVFSIVVVLGCGGPPDLDPVDGGNTGGGSDAGTRDAGTDSGTPDETPDSGTPDETPDSGTPDAGASLATLSVVKTGDGSGVISSDPAGAISCGADCEEEVEEGTTLTLTATPAMGSTFTGWSGACSGTGTCTVTVSADTTVQAGFALEAFPLTVSHAGGGSGVVSSSSHASEIDCEPDCAGFFPFGTEVTLVATPAADSTFTGWSGACAGTGACVVTISAATAVTATFEVRQVTAQIARSGAGSGTVVSVPAGAIDCGSDCEQVVPVNSQLVLDAIPDANSTFTGWSGGGCSGNDTCSALIDDSLTITAEFALRSYSLNVSRQGTGSGDIESTSPAGGIDCGSDCSELYLHGTMVTLAATPDANSTFLGWTGGGCSGTGACTVTMTNHHAVVANFGRPARTLTVVTAGSGSGTVVSSPSGIDCGSDCEETYPYATEVSLTPTAEAGSTFTGWSGACSGTGACTVTMTAEASVTANFALNTYPLTVTLAGTGAGKVVSAPAGIDCGADCSESYAHGTSVTLTPQPTAGNVFGGWSGACTGTGTCTVPMTQARDVTASFEPQTFTLTVQLSGTGIGAVTSSPSGIDCGTDCTEPLVVGTAVTLTAAPHVSSAFTGWSGACTGTGPCNVVINANTFVRATFATTSYRLNVLRNGSGTGTVTSAPAGIDCGTDCNHNYIGGTSVTLTATANPGSTFTGWSGGGCTGTDTCEVTVIAATTVTATFALPSYPLTVLKDGAGAGTVISTNPAGGISCGEDCIESYTQGTSVTLSATPDANSTFVGWSGGGCVGVANCVVPVNAATEVTATFALKTWVLQVSPQGSPGGAGTVTSLPAGIDCGGSCSQAFDHGTLVTLTAVPDAWSVFTGWSGGGCSGTGTCQVTMTASVTVVAGYATKANLTVVRAGGGNGTVVSTAPAGNGIDCGADCTQNYPHGTQVTLAATAAPGSVFVGWNAPVGCTTTGPCVVTVMGNTGVTATFLPLEGLTVQLLGTGTGTVTSNPAGISCGADCYEPYTNGTVVALTATPGPDMVFSGWSGGGCSGTGVCNVTVNAATTVTATFDLPHTLTVSLNNLGAASGMVQSFTPGIACGADCSERYATGTNVVLTATPSSGYVFGGWTGACTGFGGCVVSMNASKAVTATFAEQPNYMFVTSTTYTGDLGGFAGADAKCAAAAAAGGLPGTYRAWLSTPSVSAISRLGQASGWVRPDGRPVFNSQADLTSGRVQYLPTMTELGTEWANPYVRTGTRTNGTFSGSSSCTDWTVANTDTATVGSARISDGQFTSANTFACTTPLPIYCFGIDRRGAAYVPPGGPERLAFLSGSRFGPATSGIAQADALCAADAAAANLPGTYKALLATNGASAASRFNTAGQPWARVDGVLLATTAAGMFSGDWLTGLNRMAGGGVHVANQSVWSGATSMTAGGSAATTCDDWSPAGTNGAAGITGHSLVSTAFGSNSRSCTDTPAPLLYCLQE